MRELPVEYHKYLKDNCNAYFKLGVAYKKAGKMSRAFVCMAKSFFSRPVRFVKLLKGCP